MFTVIYSFEVHPGMEETFIEGWKELTFLIRDYEGGLGSRLHQLSDNEYLAYAQWPDRKAWEEAGGNLPDEAQVWRDKMKSSCVKIETKYELTVVEDLLVK